MEQRDEEVGNFILVGKRVVWYGSLNMFSKTEDDDSLLRLEDATYYDDFLQLVMPRESGLFPDE
ncbi:hypothetical protein [Parasphaerochaeta coccoides]|uniref:hypothetical protein n=1 Tax=Parasphaerochaeta coccoides TaxID=273376 RepID=UPI0002D9BA99|nr:hypothetical protein [Parasphaerochaeta coccoides]